MSEFKDIKDFAEKYCDIPKQLTRQKYKWSAQDRLIYNSVVDGYNFSQEQINCELSELLEQRNEMLEVFEDLISKMPLSDNFAYATERNYIKQLIKKVKDNE